MPGSATILDVNPAADAEGQAELESCGHEVVVCRGPGEVGMCPLVEDGSCALVDAADGVVFASGDTTKHDEYRLEFAAADRPITAIRLEALPDERLPANGPGLTYYEGTKGDFFLTEFVVEAGRKVSFARATEGYAKNRFGKKPVAAALATGRRAEAGVLLAAVALCLVARTLFKAYPDSLLATAKPVACLLLVGVVALRLRSTGPDGARGRPA